MLPDSDLELGQFRLLDVDNKVVIPTDTHIRLIQEIKPALGLTRNVPGR